MDLENDRQNSQTHGKQTATNKSKAEREDKKQNVRVLRQKSKTQTHEQPKAQSPCICHLIAPLQKKRKKQRITQQHSAEFVDPKTIPVVGAAH
jgi:hypothetical protein